MTAMNNSLGFVLCVVLSGTAAAQVYKWVDKNGVTHYAEVAPHGVPAAEIDIRPPLGVVTDDVTKCHGIRCQGEEPDAMKQAETPKLAEVPNQVRGLAFDIFIQIQRGMTEAEVLIRAGKPDLEETEGTAENSAASASTSNSVNPKTDAVTRNTNIIKNTITEVVKTYYYLPTISDPFTTVITFRGGRVADIQRIRKL
jgi:hypothetical protein